MKTTQILFRAPAALWILVVGASALTGGDWMAFVEATGFLTGTYALLGIFLKYVRDIAV